MFVAKRSVPARSEDIGNAPRPADSVSVIVKRVAFAGGD